MGPQGGGRPVPADAVHRFLQVAQTVSVHHGALACLLGINALHASEAAAERIDRSTAATPTGW